MSEFEANRLKDYRKRLRGAAYPELEKALYKWFEQVRSMTGEFNLQGADFMDFVTADDYVATSGEMTLSEIAADVSTPSVDGAAVVESDYEDLAPVLLSVEEAWTSFKKLTNFVTSEDIDEATVFAIRKVEDNILGRMVTKVAQQTKITDFFQSVNFVD
ncbi:Uncharacterised protein r2_g1034 [Pycnogonum litorale]